MNLQSKTVEYGPGPSPQNDVDRAFLERAVAQSNLNALRVALYQDTGDEYLTSIPLTTTPFMGGLFDAMIIAPSHQEAFKKWAVERLLGGPIPKPNSPSKELARKLMEMYGGREVSDFEFRFGLEELAFDPFPRGVDWRKETNPPKETIKQFEVIVIGAGLSGILTGIQLDRLGIPYTIIEREAGMGGTWWVHDYPDCRVDIASHVYQYSFEKNPNWTHWYADQKQLMNYTIRIAEKYDVAKNIVYNTDMKKATWDEASATWKLECMSNGKPRELRANAIISATGIFGPAKLPDFPGVDSFKGPKFHSSKWDYNVSYEGKRVAIFGTGSSGAQLMPRVAEQASQVTVYQRTPAWIIPIDIYRQPIPQETQWLFHNVPNYLTWTCYAQYWNLYSDVEGIFEYDREWQAQGGLVSKRNDRFRHLLLENLKKKLAGRPDLIEKCTPKYPPASKRPVVDNGFYEALLRPNVELVTNPVERITSKGVLTRDGEEREFDIIIFATGMTAEPWGAPAEYVGRNGRTLTELWAKDGNRSYLGLTCPGYPNLFMIHGPQSGIRAGGLIRWIEDWVRYTVKALRNVIENEARYIDVREDVFNEYNARMDKRLETFVFTAEGNYSYYKNKFGRAAFVQPWRPNEILEWLYEPNMDDYVVR